MGLHANKKSRSGIYLLFDERSFSRLCGDQCVLSSALMEDMHRLSCPIYDIDDLSAVTKFEKDKAHTADLFK